MHINISYFIFNIIYIYIYKILIDINTDHGWFTLTLIMICCKSKYFFYLHQTLNNVLKIVQL